MILVFPQGFAEVGKNEKKGFRGEATPSREMFFEFFPTEVTWETLKSHENRFFPKTGKGKISKTECFFHLAAFFVEFDSKMIINMTSKCTK